MLTSHTTGTCIGRRNYRTFLWFVNLVLFNCLFITAGAVLKLALWGRQAGPYGYGTPYDSLSDRIGVRNFDENSSYVWHVQARPQEIISLVLCAFCFLVFCAVSYLSILHWYLSAVNTSTKEHVSLKFKIIFWRENEMKFPWNFDWNYASLRRLGWRSQILITEVGSKISLSYFASRRHQRECQTCHLDVFDISDRYMDPRQLYREREIEVRIEKQKILIKNWNFAGRTCRERAEIEWTYR